MSGDMQYKQAPKDHLRTWAGLIKVSAWTCAGVILLNSRPYAPETHSGCIGSGDGHGSPTRNGTSPGRNENYRSEPGGLT